jgi:hypothetical protein
MAKEAEKEESQDADSYSGPSVFGAGPKLYRVVWQTEWNVGATVKTEYRDEVKDTGNEEEDGEEKTDPQEGGRMLCFGEEYVIAVNLER